MTAGNSMKNMMTFDIEDWFHSNLEGVDSDAWEGYERRVVEPTQRLLQALDETRNRATFFVLGKVAEEFPGLVREIRQGGHEIASHGFGHQLVYRQTENEFRLDLKKSVAVLEDVTGEKVRGYRAPSWSINEKTPWAWDCFREFGIEYDASLYPFATYLYGSNEAPRFAHQIVSPGLSAIQEVPPSVVELFHKRIPFCGGFFLRAFPLSFVKWCVRRINTHDQQPAVLYLHPWEIDVGQPRLQLSMKERFIKYGNLAGTEAKLRKLLQAFRFGTIQEFLSSKKAPESLPAHSPV